MYRTFTDEFGKKDIFLMDQDVSSYYNWQNDRRTFYKKEKLQLLLITEITPLILRTQWCMNLYHNQ